MYRDDPLDDESELRDVVGDEAVDALLAATRRAGVEVAVDVLHVLRGWVDDTRAGVWLRSPQKRLDDRSPLTAVAEGDGDDVLAAARAWAAAQA